MKKPHEYPLLIRIITLPIVYILMVIKIIEFIPLFIIAKINTIRDKITTE